MKIIWKQRGTYLIRFDRGEDLLQSLERVCDQERIAGAWVTGIGGVSDPELAFYDIQKKKYLTKRYRGIFEIVSLGGTIARKENRPIIHLHVSVSGKDYRVFGGHLIKAKAGGTVELYLQKTGSLQRHFDRDTGLYLLK